MTDNQQLAKPNGEAGPNPEAIFESLALRGDIGGLKPAEKILYYRAICEKLGLDAASPTPPLLPLRLNNREILYATKAATDQLARLHNVSREIVSRETVNDVYVVRCKATLPSGRTEESIGAVGISGAKGEMLANQLMKCESKAKRRVTLSILGLGALDESEVESIPADQAVKLTAYAIKETTTQPTAVGVVSGVEEAATDEYKAAQAKLLELITKIKETGVPYAAMKDQLIQQTGKATREECNLEELNKAIVAFGEWLEDRLSRSI